MIDISPWGMIDESPEERSPERNIGILCFPYDMRVIKTKLRDYQYSSQAFVV